MICDIKEIKKIIRTLIRPKNTTGGSLCPKCGMDTLWFKITRPNAVCYNKLCHAKFDIIYKGAKDLNSTMHRSYILKEIK